MDTHKKNKKKKKEEEGEKEGEKKTGWRIKSFLFSKQTLIEFQRSFPNLIFIDIGITRGWKHVV